MDLTRTAIDELFPPNAAGKPSSACETIEDRLSTLAETAMLTAVEAAVKRARRCGRYERLTARDVARTMPERKAVFVLAEQAAFIKTESSQGGKLLCLGEPDVALDQPLEVVGKLPAAPTFTTHWLAVDGVQPAIPENSSPAADGKGANSAMAAAALAEPALSREMQLYLDKVIEVLVASESDCADERLYALLSALSYDAGLDKLTPFLVRLCAQRVSTHLRQLPALTACVRLAAALVRNPHLTNLDLYLHELCPAVLTCVLGKRLCASFTDNHWDLRSEAAGVVADMCARFGPSYADLEPRIVKTLAEALRGQPPRPLTTQYGAIVALARLGALVVDAVVEPLVCEGDFIARLERASAVEVLDASSPDADAQFALREEATRVLHAVKQAAQQSNSKRFRAMLGDKLPPVDALFRLAA